MTSITSVLTVRNAESALEIVVVDEVPAPPGTNGPWVERSAVARALDSESWRRETDS